MIEPIKLLKGSHEDTASTGHGGFMNAVAYLNGEAQITDQSECVCFVMRPLVIYANDLFNDDRQKLLPFILRALGSRTDDKAVITDRLRHVVAFAEKQGQCAAKYAAKYADWYAAKYAEYAAKYAAEYAAKYADRYVAKYAEFAAKYAVWSAEYADKYPDWCNTTRDDLLTLFDVGFPQLTEQQAVHIERAKRLHEMAQI